MTRVVPVALFLSGCLLGLAPARLDAQPAPTDLSQACLAEAAAQRAQILTPYPLGNGTLVPRTDDFSSRRAETRRDVGAYDAEVAAEQLDASVRHLNDLLGQPPNGFNSGPYNGIPWARFEICLLRIRLAALRATPVPPTPAPARPPAPVPVTPAANTLKPVDPTTPREPNKPEPAKVKKAHNPGQSAMHCVKLIDEGAASNAGGAFNRWRLANNCRVPVEMFWCTDDECDQDRGNTWTIFPRNSWPVSSRRYIRFGACIGENSGGFQTLSNGKRIVCTDVP